MKGSTEIATITNESSIEISANTNHISNTSITNNNTEQLCMKSPSNITTITNEPYTKLFSAINHVSKSLITNNNTEQLSI